MGHDRRHSLESHEQGEQMNWVIKWLNRQCERGKKLSEFIDRKIGGMENKQNNKRVYVINSCNDNNQAHLARWSRNEKNNNKKQGKAGIKYI